MGVMPEPDLSIFEFSGEDPRSNQRGFVTPGRQAWPKATSQGIRSYSTGAALAGFGLVGLGWSGILALSIQGEDTSAALFSGALTVPVLAASYLLASLFISLGVILARWVAAQPEHAPPQAAAGIARFDRSCSPHRDFELLRARWRQEIWSWTRKTVHLFTGGAPYRVYCGKAESAR
jgi:hypothetical protein